jgi:hypothetical protein
MTEAAALADALTGAFVVAHAGGLVFTAEELACAEAALSVLWDGETISDALASVDAEALDALIERVDAVLAAWQWPN